ncbi:hypothetical protein PF003_g11572 [Phytophthora fragariae]|nr:hypothetical protein PF003_g11572 [Phytophthora fragariae]
MTTDGGTADRDQRAQRRAASVERAAAANAAKQQLLQPGSNDGHDFGNGRRRHSDAERGGDPSRVRQHAGGSGQRDLGMSGSGDAPAGQGDGSGRDSGGREDGGSQQSNPNTNADATMDMTGRGCGDGTGTRRPPPPPPPQPREVVTAASGRGPTQAGAPQRPIIVREKAKTLKLKKFKGLDDTMPVTMWLKTVRAEVRRQAVSLGVTWQEKQLYHEVASNLDSEAQRWFATVMESVPEDEENINTLAGMLRGQVHDATYRVRKWSTLLNARRQMRGERLVEYAQSLREIGERGDVGEDWLVERIPQGNEQQ